MGPVTPKLYQAGLRVGYAVLGMLILGAIWILIARTVQSALVPTPAESFETIYLNFFDIEALKYIYYSSSGLVENLWYTIQNVLTSVALGSVAGTLFGTILARSRFLKLIAEPPLLVMGMFPVIMLLPFFTMWFGTARIALYGLVLFYTFVTVALVARSATENVSGYFENYASSLGASRRFFQKYVVLPAIVPEVIGGIRISLAAGWGFETVAEILGAPLGAGRLIQVFSVAVMTADIFGVLICMGVIAVIADAIVAAVGRWAVRWKD